MNTKPKWYLTTKEVACILGISTTTVRSYCRCGELTHYTYDGIRILVSSRELIEKRREFDRDYNWFSDAMARSGWKRITKDESYYIEHGTICSVRIGGNEWERWHNQNEDAEPPDEVDMFYYRVTYIVPLGSGAENTEYGLN